MLQFMGLQRVRYDWATELNWTELSLLGCPHSAYGVCVSKQIHFLPITLSRNTFPMKQELSVHHDRIYHLLLSHSLWARNRGRIVWLALVWGAVAASMGACSSWELTGHFSSRGLCISCLFSRVGDLGLLTTWLLHSSYLAFKEAQGSIARGTQGSLLFWSLGSHARTLPLRCTRWGIIEVQPASRGGSIDFPFLMGGVGLWGEYVIQETSSGPPLWDAGRRYYYCLLSSWHSHILKELCPHCWRNMGLRVFFLIEIK